MHKKILPTLLCTAALAATSAAQAATVTFSNLADGNNSALFFDLGTTSQSGNTLTLGLNNFTANGQSTLSLSALDTLSFLVTAPAGFHITRISYTENGTGQTTNGVALATGSLTADGIPKNFLTQMFTPNTGASNWSISGSIDIANKDSIAVSIVNSLFAVTFGGISDIATVSKTGASIEVQVAPVPLPPAVWMLGSALVGLATVGRRKFS